MGSVPIPSRKSISIVIGILTILWVGLLANTPSAKVTFAQDEPTDPPFPTAITTAAAESTIAPPLESTAGASSLSSTAAATPAASASEATAQATQALSVEEAVSTITALQAQNKDLQDKLSSAELDKGATLYAVVIVVIGLLLAFAVFFGLRRSGK